MRFAFAQPAEHLFIFDDDELPRIFPFGRGRHQCRAQDSFHLFRGKQFVGKLPGTSSILNQCCKTYHLFSLFLCLIY